MNKNNGFTLVEMMVVMAIIALLATITFSGVQAMRGRADNVVCTSNLRSMGQAVHNYAGEHEGRFPGPVWYNVSHTYRRLSSYAPLSMHIGPYLGMPEWGDMVPQQDYVLVQALCPTHRRLNPDSAAYYSRHSDAGNSPFGGENRSEGPGYSTYGSLTMMNAPALLRRDMKDIMAIREIRPAGTTQHSPGHHSGNANVLFLDGHVESIPGAGRDILRGERL